jgi:hypothetical protein
MCPTYRIIMLLRYSLKLIQFLWTLFIDIIETSIKTIFEYTIGATQQFGNFATWRYLLTVDYNYCKCEHDED